MASQPGCGSGEEGIDLHLHGPHGGHTLEMASAKDYSLEFTLDEKRSLIILYAYDPSDDSPVPIHASYLDAKFEAGGNSFIFLFAADPRTSDPQGSSSRFSFSLNDLPQQLISAQQFTVTVTYLDGDESVTAWMKHANNHRHDYQHD